MADENDTRQFDVVPVLVLVGVVAAVLLGWWLYPKVQHYLAQQDCIAVGHTNCQ
jgi:hypothetical protein